MPHTHIMIEELHPVDRQPRGATGTAGHTVAGQAAAHDSDETDDVSTSNSTNANTTTGGQETAATRYDDADLPNAFDGPHFTGNGHFGPFTPARPWRIRDRMKTVSVALVVCLNVGVDPPDVFKITPSARLECWIDPQSMSSQKAMEMIGINLQRQYEQWQPRARYKQSLDPTYEDIKKLCSTLRRNAKEERVLFHYNGHGVPRPTVNGEIWVFNRTYTQYIPLSIYDLQQWIGAPSIYVYDCSNAGIIVNLFNQFAEQHEREHEQQQKDQPDSTGGGAAAAAPPPTPQPPAAAAAPPGTTAQQPPTPASFKNCIQMAACAANQILPMNPALPADLFTSCLTTPIKTALKWFTLKQTVAMVPHVSYDLIERIPGENSDRRTMLGELNWIFIAITDTIAWNVLPRDVFQTLFRQDLLVASLFRNFLLAERIMRSYDCTPVSNPPFPACHRHPMWANWDLALDLAVKQLPAMLEHDLPYQSSPFFRDQLSAFHVWLEQGCAERHPPEQLPIVLQVLLSSTHRLRALELLGRFMDLGPWAVHLALSVGIFPYVLKLLQAQSSVLRPLLVFFWAKIMAVDQTCQVDLVCDQGHKYFVDVLQDAAMSAEQRTMAAFVLASAVHGFPMGQSRALQCSLVAICLEQLGDSEPRLRQWLAICLGHLWQNYDKARWSGVRDLAHDKLYPLLVDEVPEVRAAAVYALGTFISSVTSAKDRTEHANNIDRSIAMEMLSRVGGDMSPMVRMELIAAFQWMIVLFENQFVSAFLQEGGGGGGSGGWLPSAAFRSMSLQHQQQSMSSSSQQTSSPLPQQLHQPNYWSPGGGGGGGTNSLERNINMKRVASSSSIAAMQHFPSTTIIGFGSTYMKLWQALIVLARDPHPAVAALAQRAIDFVVNQVVDLVSAKEAAKENYGASGSGGSSSTAGSMSLPPSPNTRGHYLSGAGVGVAESPPAHHQPHINVSTPSPGAKMFASANGSISGRRGATPVAAAAAPAASTASSRSRKNSRHAATDESDAEKSGDAAAAKPQQKPIVTTDFIPWCVAQFSAPSRTKRTSDLVDDSGSTDADPAGHKNAGAVDDDQGVDRHCPVYLRRMERFRRNEATRQLARDQKLRAIFHRLETQSWSSRTQNVARVVRLHPYELQIAVAYRNKITVNDWTTQTIQAYVPAAAPASAAATSAAAGKSAAAPASPESPVCTVDFVNAHDRTLIMAGYDDGCVRIWRPPGDDDAQPNTCPSSSASTAAEPRLVTAWQAMHDIQTAGRLQQNTGMLLTWQQRSQTVVCGGESKWLRCWDARSERKCGDLPTGSDAPVSALSSSTAGGGAASLLAAGFRDGSVRLYDRRLAGADALVRTFRETSGCIVAACLRDDADHLVVGCATRYVRLFDVRQLNGSMAKWRTDGDLEQMDVHRSADILACGNGTAGISVYGLDGRLLSAIRSQGFMGGKTGSGSVACLAFHPLKVSLAAGFQDQTVAVYVTDSKRYAM